jgi:hypothetical protein
MYKEFKPAYPKFNEVFDQCKALADQYGNWEYNWNGQVAIQTNDDSQEDWYVGTGPGTGKTLEWEHSFNKLQPSLKGTALDEYIQWLGVPVYRTRIMMAREKGCYSIHRDYSPRLHLPLITNKQCNFLFTDPLAMYHMPVDGRTMWVDTRLPHTFFNGSVEKRLHLVMIVEE